MKILYAQTEILSGKPAQNFARCAEIVAKAKAQYADLLIFPELVIPGKLLGDILDEDDFDHPFDVRVVVDDFGHGQNELDDPFGVDIRRRGFCPENIGMGGENALRVLFDQHIIVDDSEEVQ